MKKPPVLTSNAAMGGLRAKGGFGYQIWDALVRLPAWLKNPAFEGVIFEGLEDTEARFFAPHSPHGHLLDRFQAKSAVLTRAEILEVVTNFREFAETCPGIARVQTLVTPQLPSSLAWIEADPERVRHARPFFAPFAQVMSASDSKLTDRLTKEFGADVGSFIAEAVEISLRPFPDENTMEASFAAAFNAAFPQHDLGARKAAEVFGSLVLLADKSLGKMLTRKMLIAHLAESLGGRLELPESLPVHVRSDRNAPTSDAIEIDAAPFSGVNGIFLPSDRWREELRAPLERTAAWALQHGWARITLSGAFRLSTGFVLGHAFRSAVGFDLEIPTRDGAWSTDDRPSTTAPRLDLEIGTRPRLRKDRLIVTIGVIRDPTPAVLATLSAQSDELFALQTTSPVADGQSAQSLVGAIKAAIGETVSALRPASIDLFYVGPAALAVALGHRWNGLPPTQLYEFNQQDGLYTPTALIGS